MELTPDEISFLSASGIPEEQMKRSAIFMGYSMRRMMEAWKRKVKFVHYTRAENLKPIFDTKSFWMRKTSCMNDYSEIQHGIECLTEAWFHKAGIRFRALLDKIYPDLSKKVGSTFDEWKTNILFDTYVACFSEYYDDGTTPADKREYDLGRLSMWRAYGQGTAVAIFFRGDAFFKPQPKLGIVASPVAYMDGSEFIVRLSEVADDVEANIDFLKTCEEDDLKWQVFHMLRHSVIGTKHPGFSEEREWRLVYTPLLDGKSPALENDIAILNGVPQLVWKIPLRDISEHDVSGITLRDLLDRIVIGPTQYPTAVAGAIAKLLEKEGFDKSDHLVKCSLIPLRT